MDTDKIKQLQEMSDNLQKATNELAPQMKSLQAKMEEMKVMAEQYKQKDLTDIVIDGNKCSVSHSDNGVVIITFDAPNNANIFHHKLITNK
ncbi:hypothetical protein UFOVP941_12 [uncultured Caudovirales phage]|uniref:Uncharacterized protein n=1 Tax=uncultured Caudovirales phage TaxID=2100421 RepID=A0A6J5PNZ0_9CAUD|nr:hypothetical protein UFOVP941_12 [uncultured Caudovirales phage]CAB4202284.1 hypothetical protein UFOVP1373_7 [uncultured Caudovirales phage]